MTRYTVVWHDSTLDELAEIWVNARDRNAVTTAAHIIDVELSETLRPRVWKSPRAYEHFSLRHSEFSSTLTKATASSKSLVSDASDRLSLIDL